jgi:hypothetical protein
MTTPLRLTAVPAIGLRSSQPAGAVVRQLLERLVLQVQSQVLITNGEREIAIWVYASDALPECEAPPKMQPEDVIWLSKRARDFLGTDASPVVWLVPPATDALLVVPALIDDLPPVNVAHVSYNTRQRLASPGGWSVLFTEGWTMPVRLHGRKMPDDHIRLSHHSRALLGLEREGHGSESNAVAQSARQSTPAHFRRVQVSAMIEPRLRWSESFGRRSPFGRRFGPAAGAALFLYQLLAQLAEWLLRPLIRAPAVALRTTEALAGDDTNQVIRLSREVFPLLGVKPGDQLIVNWAGRQAIGTVLEALAIDEEERARLGEYQGVDMPTRDARIIPLDYLSVGISAEMRADLGMNRHTVVTLRRRLLTILIERANDLTIPVGGLILAALLVPGMSLVFLALGIVAVLVLGMAPIRYKSPPRGRWP